MAVLQQFPIFSINKLSWMAIVPLAVILLLQAIKDAYEDYGRHKSDQILNESPCWVLKEFRNAQFPDSPNIPTLPDEKSPRPQYTNGWHQAMRKDLRAGDLTLLLAGQQIPADIVALASNAEHIFVSTKSLDGESTLKKKHACGGAEIRNPAECNLGSMVISFEPPTPDLYSFSGLMTLDSELQRPITIDNLVLAGSILRNTDWVAGVVVGPGKNSKVALNMLTYTKKSSRLDRLLNIQILFNLILLVALSLLVSIPIPFGNYALWDSYICPDSFCRPRIWFITFL